MEGLVRAAVAGILWGMTGVFARAAYNAGEVAPLLVSFLRMALAVPVLAAAWALFERNGARDKTSGAAGLFFLFGAVAAAYQVLYFSAVALTTVTSATLLLALAPVFVALWGRLFLGEELERRVLVWGAVAVVGAALVAVGGAQADGGAGSGGSGGSDMRRMLLGDALAVGASVAYSFYYVLGRRAFRLAGPLYGSIRVFSWAALLLGAAALFTGQYHAALPARGWLALGLMGLVATGAAYVFYFTALASTKAVLVSLGGLLEPVTAAALAWALFGETLGALGLVGAAMLFLALVTLSVTPRRAPAAEPPAQAR